MVQIPTINRATNKYVVEVYKTEKNNIAEVNKKPAPAEQSLPTLSNTI